MSEYIYTTEGTFGLRECTGEEVVRCRDCKFSREVEWPEWMNVPSDYLDCHGELVETWDYYNDEPNNNPVKPDGFCAWGTKTDFVTCKCGEDIERIGRIQTCPSCGRKVMA